MQLLEEMRDTVPKESDFLRAWRPEQRPLASRVSSSSLLWLLHGTSCAVM